MASGNVIVDNGRKTILNRAFKGTPDYLAPTQFKIGTGTTTPSTADTDMETPVNINGTEFKNFVSGYPILDETNMEVTFRCLVTTTEGNSNTLTEFGMINEDSSRLLLSHAVHTAIAKDNTYQIVYIEKDSISTS